VNPWSFVAAAYAVTLLAAAMLAVVSHRAMRRAERAIEDRDR
jgi:heme exporter protein D